MTDAIKDVKQPPLELYNIDTDLLRDYDKAPIEKQNTTMSDIDFWKYVYSAFLAAIMAHFVIKFIEFVLRKTAKEIAIIVEE